MFVGRDSEVTRLRALFSTLRLVTLHGPPGIGKTAIAHAFATHEPDVVFCDLTSAKTAEDVAFVLAGALEVSLGGGKNLGRILADAVARRANALVVFDGAESVPDAVAALVTELLGAPHGTKGRDKTAVRVLVTSRELLRVESEAALPIGPLDDDAAFAVFAQTAQRVRAGFDPEPHTATIRELVHILSNVPLALVLAASRITVMDAPALLARTREKLDWLSAHRRDASERHASLRGAFESSIATLQEGERAALAACTIFRGAFSLEAAEHVVLLGGETRVADALQSLVDKSLLRSWEEEDTGVRFAMLEILRRLAIESLGAAAPDRHSAYYAREGESWDSESWYGGVAALPRLLTMRDNLLAAHAHAIGDDALRTTIALYPIYAARGPHEAFVTLMESAMPFAETADVGLASRFFLVRGRGLQLCGMRDEAAAAFERALQCARKSGRPALAARSLAYLALARRTQGSLSEARERFEASATLFREAGDAKSEAVVLSGLASLDLAEADLDGAKRSLEAAIDVLIVSGDPATAAMMRVDLGIVLQEMGDLEGARGVYEAALVAHRTAGNRRHEGITLGYLGTLEDEQGRTDAAEVALVQSLGVLGEIGDSKYIAVFGGCLAAVRAQRGDAAGAEGALLEAERSARDAEARIVATVALHRLRVETAAGRGARAAVERRGAAVGLLQQSDDVRFAARMLDRVLVPEPTPSQVARAQTLCVGEDATWLELPGGKRIDLTRRTVHRRLVQRLVRERVAAPGSPVTVSELVSAGWPAEKLTESSAQNRLHVALASLRADGLRDHLKREPRGYLLDPTVEIRVQR